MPRNVHPDMGRRICFRNRNTEQDVLYVNGAYGGRGSNGDVFINLFVEYPMIGETDVHELGPDGRIDPRNLEQPSDQIIDRRVVCRIAMSEVNVRTLITWLNGVLTGQKPVEAPSVSENGDTFRIVE